MLKKLLKYDLKYMIKNMMVFYILALFCSLLTRIFFSLEQATIVNVIGQITVGCMFSMVASILFNTVIRSWVRFKDSLYKDEAYLTHTLPVSKTEIYESRFIQANIFTIIGFILMIVSIFVTYYTQERWLLLKSTINSIQNGIELNVWFIIVSVIIIFFLEVINVIQSGFFGIILGNRKNDKKAGYSFLYGFIIFMFSQVFVVFELFIIGLFNSKVMDLFISSASIDSNTLKFLIFLALLIYILIIMIMNIMCTKELKKGVNID